MVRSLKYILVLTILVAAVSLGFLGGRNLRHEHVRLHGNHTSALTLSASSDSSSLLGDSGGQEGQDADVAPADIFETVLDHVQKEYVEGVGSDQKLSNGALARMVASLDDPKTSFMDPSLRQARQDALAGRFHGIGAVLTNVSIKKGEVDYRYLSVVDTMPGSPAEKAGLKPGDHITDIDGHWVIAYSILIDVERLRKAKLDDAALKEEVSKVSTRFKKGYTLTKATTTLSAGEGKSLQLMVERAGTAAPLKINLTSAVTEVDPVEFRVLNKHVGYLRVRQFNSKATAEFQHDLNSLKPDVKGLIVDLRGNPGGVRAEANTGANGYDSALKLIARLTHGGAVANIELKPNKREPLTVTANQPVTLPLVVLVDNGAANLSELVASALRDAGKAKILGARTFGDDVLQSFNVLKDGSGLVIATAHLFTLKNVDLAQGVTPDIPIPAGAGQDAVLDRAVKALETGA